MLALVVVYLMESVDKDSASGDMLTNFVQIFDTISEISISEPVKKDNLIAAHEVSH